MAEHGNGFDMSGKTKKTPEQGSGMDVAGKVCWWVLAIMILTLLTSGVAYLVSRP